MATVLPRSSYHSLGLAAANLRTAFSGMSTSLSMASKLSTSVGGPGSTRLGGQQLTLRKVLNLGPVDRRDDLFMQVGALFFFLLFLPSSLFSLFCFPLVPFISSYIHPSLRATLYSLLLFLVLFSFSSHTTSLFPSRSSQRTIGTATSAKRSFRSKSTTPRRVRSISLRWSRMRSALL
jgi:hypothetical protein